MVCRQWSAEDNMYYSLNESFDREERSALQVSVARSLSVDHAASQLMAPCTHYAHHNFDQLFYPEELQRMCITIPGEFADTVYRNVCFTCYKEYDQNNVNGPREHFRSIGSYNKACRHYRYCMHARIEPESDSIPQKPKRQAHDINVIKRSKDDDAKTAADIIGVEGFEAILKDNQYGLGPKEPGDFHDNSIVAGAMWLVPAATISLREEIGRRQMDVCFKRNGIHMRILHGSDYSDLVVVLMPVCQACGWCLQFDYGWFVIGGRIIGGWYFAKYGSISCKMPMNGAIALYLRRHARMSFITRTVIPVGKLANLFFL